MWELLKIALAFSWLMAKVHLLSMWEWRCRQNWAQDDATEAVEMQALLGLVFLKFLVLFSQMFRKCYFAWKVNKIPESVKIRNWIYVNFVN